MHIKSRDVKFVALLSLFAKNCLELSGYVIVQEQHLHILRLSVLSERQGRSLVSIA